MSSEQQRSRPAGSIANQTNVHARRPADEPVDRPPRRITVVAGIVSATILFISVVALFVFRSLAGREPQQVAIVVGNEQWTGARLTVTNLSQPGTHRARLNHTQRYSVPFFLPPGHYELRVAVAETDVYAMRFELASQQTIELPLPAQIPAPLPATQPAAASPDQVQR